MWFDPELAKFPRGNSIQRAIRGALRKRGYVLDGEVRRGKRERGHGGCREEGEEA